MQIEIEWPTEWTHEAQTSKSKVPDFSKGWSILPQGTWIIRRRQNNEGRWDFPEPLGEGDDQRYIPQFKLEDKGGWNSHRIVSIKFTDSQNKTWLREYNEESTCKLLSSAADKN